MRNRRDWPMSTKLVGGFNCDLTSTERNEWAEFIHENDALKKFVVAESIWMSLVATRNPTNQGLEALAAAVLLKEDELIKLFHIGKQWYADVIEKRDEEEAAKDDES